MVDRLEEMFKLQRDFMDLLAAHGKFPEYPVDLSTKPGQSLAKQIIYNIVEELMEASFTLKNKVHRLTDAREVDVEHYTEELGDAFAFFMELCIVSGIDPEKLFRQFKKKNSIVKERLENGY